MNGSMSPMGGGALSMERRLAAAQEQVDLITSGLSDHAFFALDRAGRVHEWSAAAGRLLGYAPADILGLHVSVLQAATDAGQPVAACLDGKTMEAELWILRGDGSRFWSRCSIRALADAAPQGEAGYLVSVHDRPSR